MPSSPAESPISEADGREGGEGASKERVMTKIRRARLLGTGWDDDLLVEEVEAEIGDPDGEQVEIECSIFIAPSVSRTKPWGRCTSAYRWIS